MRRTLLLLATLTAGLLPGCDGDDPAPEGPDMAQVPIQETPDPPRPDGKIHVTFAAPATSPQGEFKAQSLVVTLGGQTRSMTLDPRQPSLSVRFTMDGPGLVDAEYTLHGTYREADGVASPRELWGQQQFVINEDDEIHLDPSGPDYRNLQLARKVPSFKVPPPVEPGKGRGKITCGSCAGSGKQGCSVCGGTGSIRKSIRNYDPKGRDDFRYFSCWNCTGTGQRRCSGCGGDGNK